MSEEVMDRREITASLTKQMGFLLMGRGLAFLFTFFIPVVLARTFSVEEFGLYKQIFLISGTLLIILRFGLDPSLYYFLPRNIEQKNVYISQTIILYIVLGSIAFLMSFVLNDWVSRLLNSPDLAKLFPLITLFTSLLLLSMPIETVMISLKRAQWASIVIFCTDAARALLIMGAAVFVHTIESIIYGVLLLAVGRLIMFAIYLYNRLKFSFSRLRRELVRDQLHYAVPFAFATVARFFSQSIHFYIVSHFCQVSLFAVYSIGFLQVPLVSIIFDSVLEATMVRITEFAERNDISKVCFIISNALRKLSLVFFPLSIFLAINAKEIIITLYTPKFQDSIPIFMVSVFLIAFEVLDLNYVLRALGSVKFLLGLNLIRLFLTIVFVALGLKIVGLLGAAIGVLASFIVTNVIILLKVKNLLNVRVGLILPFKDVRKVTIYSLVSTVPVFGFGFLFDLHRISFLAITFLLFMGLYLLLIYKSKMISEESKMVRGLVKRVAARLAWTL